MSSDAVASSDVAISIRDLGKCYQMYDKPAHRLMQGLMRTSRFAKEFWAVRDLTLEIRRGETFGIIGRNGSGKSTLLQMIAGTLSPTQGSVHVRGKVAALLELGSGFNPDFTGRENVFLNAAILGLSRTQVEDRLASIMAFADIGDFIDQPVRSYSSGMTVRLAFAVIAHVDADILIVDEALSVGDAFFAQKCMRYLREFQKNGTLLFVSHDSGAVTNLCDRAIWLDEGRIRLEGDSKSVVETYLAQQHATERGRVAQHAVKVAVSSDNQGNRELDERDVRQRRGDAAMPRASFDVFEFDPDNTGMAFGAGGARIVDVQLNDDDGNALHVLQGGEVVRLSIKVELLQPLDRVILGFYLKDRLGQRLFGDNTHMSTRDQSPRGAAGDRLTAEFRFRMPTLPSGSYLFDVAVASGTQEDHTQHHWIHDALQIRATETTMRHGLVGIPMLDIQLVREERA